MLIDVKPGSVFISLKIIFSSLVTKKSTREKSRQSSARKIVKARLRMRVSVSGFILITIAAQT
jgi:hypothetical protein